MDMNNVNIEEIVKQVLAGMAGTAPAASASAAPVAPAAAPAGAIPKTAHVAPIPYERQMLHVCGIYIYFTL